MKGRPADQHAPEAPGTATGRVFARFREGTKAADQAAALADAGYDIDTVPPWAPHAAWLRPRAGASFERLGRVAGLEHVEPETLRPRAHK